MIKKIITHISLVVFMLLLSGCGENPMLEPKMMLDLENEIIQHSSLKDRVLCVEYGSDPKTFSGRQPYCSTWMRNQYTGYVTRITTEMAMTNTDNSTIPTFENFTDPKVWQILWSEEGAKWKQELIQQKATPAKPLVKNVKTITVKKVVPVRRLERVCVLYPDSLACHRIKRALIRNTLD